MKIRRKYLFYALAFASAIITALVVSIDTVISELYIPNPAAFGLSCFLVGTLVTVIIALVFSAAMTSKTSMWMGASAVLVSRIVGTAIALGSAIDNVRKIIVKAVIPMIVFL